MNEEKSQERDRINEKNKIDKLKDEIYDKRIKIHVEYCRTIDKLKNETNLPLLSNDNNNDSTNLNSNINTNFNARSPSFYTSLNQINLKLQRDLKGHRGKVYAIDWNSKKPDDLVSAARDGKLIIWNSETTTKKLAINLNTEFVMTCTYDPTGDYVACGGLDDRCSIWYMGENAGMGYKKDYKPEVVLEGHTGYVSCCRYWTKDKIITSSGDGNIMVWDINKKENITKYSDHDRDVMSISVGSNDTNYPNNNLLLSGGIDKSTKLWDLRKKKCINSYTGTGSDVNDVKWFPNGYSFVTGTDDGICRLYDIRVHSILQVYDLYNNKLPNTSALNPNYSTINNNENNKKSQHDKTKSNDNHVFKVECSNSGALLFVSYYYEPWLKVWNTLNGQQLQDLPHNDRPSCIRVSHKGDKVATACWDRVIRLWGLN